MTSVWPWLAVAGVGALHGLNPATGWVFAAAWGVRSGDRTRSLRALGPIAIGHAASVGFVATAAARGISLDRHLLLAVALGVIVVVAMVHLRSRGPARASAWWAGLGLWSFMVATAHGAGMMLVPALIPLCIADSPGRAMTASGSLLLAMAVIAVHLTSMLAVTAVVALAACRGVDRINPWLGTVWRGCRVPLPFARDRPGHRDQR